MKRSVFVFLAAAMLLLSACSAPAPTGPLVVPTVPPREKPAAAETPAPEPSPEPTTEPTPEPSSEPAEKPSVSGQPGKAPGTVSAPTPTAQPDSMAIPGVSVENVLEWFNEVCLDAEFSEGSSAHLIQKWLEPIYYWVGGDATEEDLAFLDDLQEQLNAIKGFPGFYASGSQSAANVEIWFCDGPELVERMGDNFDESYYGGFYFWYTDNVIDSGIICVRDDIDQFSRNTVIVEEVYGLLGPAQDTVLRTDSVLYQYSNLNEEMSDVDLLILQLLYNTEILCGMDTEACEEVIRRLYQ